MTTTIDSSRVIVTFASSEAHSVPCAHAHHQSFPEVNGEAESAHDAVAILHARLIHALDSASSEFRRSEIEGAVADVKEFLSATP